MLLRPALEGDLPRLKALARAAWGFTYAHIYSAEFIDSFIDRCYTPEFHRLLLGRVDQGQHAMDLLVDGDEVVGIADLDLDDKGAHLMRLYLRPDLIGQGHGSALLTRAEEHARGWGRGELDLVVHRDNLLGVSFYERRGFERFTALDDPAEGDWGYRKTLA